MVITANSGVYVLTETGAVGALGTTWVSTGGAGVQSPVKVTVSSSAALENLKNITDCVTEHSCKSGSIFHGVCRVNYQISHSLM